MVGEQGDVVNLDFVYVSIYGYHRPECTLIRLDPFHGSRHGDCEKKQG